MQFDSLVNEATAMVEYPAEGELEEEQGEHTIKWKWQKKGGKNVRDEFKRERNTENRNGLIYSKNVAS